jgi:hypothetical protein
MKTDAKYFLASFQTNEGWLTHEALYALLSTQEGKQHLARTFLDELVHQLTNDSVIGNFDDIARCCKAVFHLGPPLQRRSQSHLAAYVSLQVTPKHGVSGGWIPIDDDHAIIYESMAAHLNNMHGFEFSVPEHPNYQFVVLPHAEALERFGWTRARSAIKGAVCIACRAKESDERQ